MGGPFVGPDMPCRIVIRALPSFAPPFLIDLEQPIQVRFAPAHGYRTGAPFLAAHDLYRALVVGLT